MKYYIPSSSLNLDNILQAESISPVSFYQLRKTGYNNYVVIPEFRGIKHIIMFSYPVQFFIDDPNRYNDPILIEVEDDYQLGMGKCYEFDEGAYAFNKTLYLTPYNCRIFFFSEKAYKLAIINTRDNASIKNFKSYRIYPTTDLLGRLRDIPKVTAKIDLSIDESCETIIDKQKGMLYAYLLGQKLSITPELANQKSLTQDIYNTVSGIKSFLSTNNIPFALIEKLESQLVAFKNIDFIEKENQQIFTSHLKGDASRYDISPNDLIELIKSWGAEIWQYFYKVLLSKWGRTTLPQISELHSFNDYTCLISQIEYRTNLGIANFKKAMPNPSLSSVTMKGDNVLFIDKPILTIAINYILEHKLTQSELLAKKDSICVEIVNLIKDYFIRNLGYTEEQWNHDAHRRYALKLYHSINDFNSAFNLNEASELKYDEEFIALSVFLLSGHSIDSCLKCLTMNRISDYSMSLALWGALCGYVEMNSKVLSEFLTDAIYERVYECIHGIRPYKALFKDSAPVLNQECPKLKSEDFLYVIKLVNKISAKFILILEDFLKNEFTDINNLNDFGPYCNKKQKSQYEKVKEIFNLITENPINQEFLKTFFLKKDWPYVAERLNLDTPVALKISGGHKLKKKKRKNECIEFNFGENNSNIFTDWTNTSLKCCGEAGVSNLSNQIGVTTYSNTGKSIIDDDNAIEIIKAFSGFDSHQLLDIFIDFQKSYRSGYYKKNEDRYRRNNSDVIDHFCKWCLSGKNRKALKRTPENSHKLDELKSYLLQYYHD